jgi:excisionase family DNA binding protein
MAEDRLLSLPEAAQRLGVSRHTLRSWVRQKRIAHIRLGRRVVIAPVDIERFVATHRVEVSPVFRNGRG